MTRRGDPGQTRRFASAPCLAGTADPAFSDPLAGDPQQASDVAVWRKAERLRQLADRAALSVSRREAVAATIGLHLDAMLARRFGDLRGRVISGYWPIKAEFDLRPWMERLHGAGARLALPVVEVRAAPLVFRLWSPGAAMERGHWNILVPAGDAEQVTPEIMLAPLIGWDDDGFRLGYGGGYFDRTLGAAKQRPFVIGVGLQAARIPTIFPQPHDIAMSAIVTEKGALA